MTDPSCLSVVAAYTDAIDRLIGRGGVQREDKGAPDPTVATRLDGSTPDTWHDREERVRWCLEYLTEGELHLLYKLLYETRGMRRDHCDAAIRKEQNALQQAKTP